MSELVEKIVEKCGDYRRVEGFDFNTEHVDAWLDQFPDKQRDAILSCVSTALDVSYFSRAEAEAWLDRLILNTDFTGPDPEKFWRSANLLNIQGMGRSQREMLVLLNSRLKAQIGLSIMECGASDGAFVYLDDGCFSGGHIINDLGKWLMDDAPQNADLRVVTVVSYRSGEYRSEQKLKKKIEESGERLIYCFGCADFEAIRL